MNLTSFKTALRILGHFWLEEVKAEGAEVISALPELAQTLPGLDMSILDELAVEYQRLFGFNVPPYESIFVDPSVMLMAPATERVQALYRQGRWNPPPNMRAGAPDHVGLELIALADWTETGLLDQARQLHTRHLALWLPPLAFTLRRLRPHPFYLVLADLTLNLVLSTLPDMPVSEAHELLAPPPFEHDEKVTVPQQSSSFRSAPGLDFSIFSQDESQTIGLRDLVRQLLTPRMVGIFLTREDIARVSQALDLPGVMGDRSRMLDSLFRLAGQYDLLPALFERLDRLVEETDSAYQTLADEYETWRPHAQAWCERLTATRAAFEVLKVTLEINRHA